MVGPFVGRVRDTIQEYVDQFVRDWMAAHRNVV
jgi:hypothetical protein